MNTALEYNPRDRFVGPPKHAETFVLSRLEDMAKAIDRRADISKLANIARMAVMKTPFLTKCDRRSFGFAILDALQVGLMPDGVNACIVPRRVKGQWQAMYMPMTRGMVAKLIGEGLVTGIDAECVYEGDTFSVTKGTSPQITHEVSLDPKRSEKEITHAYAIFWLPGGGVKIEVLDRAAINTIRKSADDKSFGWRSWFGEMAKKSAIRRGQKHLPRLSEALAIVEEADNRVHSGGESITAEIVEAGEQLDEADIDEATEPPGASEHMRAITAGLGKGGDS